jgi:hypothetical protein
MRYQYRNPYVNATPDLTTKNMVVDHGDGKKQVMHVEEFNKTFKPFLTPEDRKMEMLKLCQSIIDQEAMVDDDNSEALLSEAVDTARKLLRLLHS